MLTFHQLKVLCVNVDDSKDVLGNFEVEAGTTITADSETFEILYEHRLFLLLLLSSRAGNSVQ